MNPLSFIQQLLTLAAAVVVSLVLGYGGGRLHAWHIHGVELKAAMGEAQTKARTIEQNWNDDAQVAEDLHAEQLRNLAARYDADLRRVLDARRDRLPEASATACAGTSGRELSRPDAAFLVGLARDADVVRADLQACQQREALTYRTLTGVKEK